MDKSWIDKPRLSDDYIAGVRNFVNFAFGNSNSNTMKCPCNRCVLKIFKCKEDIEGDLMCAGFMSSYTEWVLHGEGLTGTGGTQPVGTDYNSTPADLDSTRTLLDDLFPDLVSTNDDSFEEPTDTEIPSTTTDSSSKQGLDEMIAEFNEELYTGCTKFTRLSFILKLYHIKCICGISDKGISMFIELLKEAFGYAKLPASFNDMKRVIRKLGMSYDSIDACPNDCMLFWEDNVDKEVCDVCAASRWKVNKSDQVSTESSGNTEVLENSQSVEIRGVVKKVVKKKKVPAKVLRYFPLKPRLQRLYMSSKTAEDMRWHGTTTNTDGKLRHPRDGDAWKAFNARFEEFASETRNVRLGLATDGFNPFGTMSQSYSIWPVILFPYNLPPWMAMKQTSMILSTLIPGKKAPGNDIDVYMQPLIKELKELWFEGVTTVDASTKETFKMKAAVLWTISDFPGFGNLSGWNTYTNLACPSCNFDTIGRRLTYWKKACFMGHRRFLPENHDFRHNVKDFDGKEETRGPPTTPTGSTVLQQLQSVNVILGKKNATVGGKRQRKETTQQWKKKSIFFELPYWEFTLLRHNLDVMHIEKNVFDNLVGTLLDDKNKSKDDLNARKDLQELGVRQYLWPDENGQYEPAPFTLRKEGKSLFLKVLKEVKLPDAYASNISSCVDLNNGKLVGLKSHDCHMIMRDLLSIAIQGLLPEDVTKAVVDLSRFFRDICSKVLDIEELDNLQVRIVETLCNMEMIFLPPFFTVMVHLIVHLTEEAKKGGPVPYRWMYPIERLVLF